MFEELRGAWREAVDNFYRELRGGVGDDARLSAMRREHAAAVQACRRVERERDRAREELEQGRAELVTYRRRREMAERIAAGPNFGHMMTKTMLAQEWSMSIERAIEAEAQAQAICMQTEDFRRAYNAFVAKEKPIFEGN